MAGAALRGENILELTRLVLKSLDPSRATLDEIATKMKELTGRNCGEILHPRWAEGVRCCVLRGWLEVEKSRLAVLFVGTAR